MIRAQRGATGQRGRRAAGGAAVGDAPARYRAVFGVAEFRAIWAAQALSLVGDQLARVALAVLVFARTGSPLWTATAFAMTFLPHLIGGPLLSGVADRWPRRAVMVRSDLVRAALVAVVAVPGLPVPALIAVVFAAELFTAPFDAARAATLPDVLPDDRYVVASSVATITNQGGQVLGFLAGGAVVAGIGPHASLFADAATFGLSAAILRIAVTDRPPATGSTTPDRARAALLAATRLILGDRRLRGLSGLAWLNGLWVVQEALAVPYAAALHAGARGAGLLLAANPVGTVIGSFALARFVAPPRRLALMHPLAWLAAAPLVACATGPGLATTFALWVLSGIGNAYNLPANAAFVTALPAQRRGQAFGLVASGIAVSQGVAAVLGGVAAQLAPAAVVVAAAGGLALALAAVLTWSWPPPSLESSAPSAARHPVTAFRRQALVPTGGGPADPGRGRGGSASHLPR